VDEVADFFVVEAAGAELVDDESFGFVDDLELEGLRILVRREILEEHVVVCDILYKREKVCFIRRG